MTVFVGFGRGPSAITTHQQRHNVEATAKTVRDEDHANAVHLYDRIQPRLSAALIREYRCSIAYLEEIAIFGLLSAGGVQLAIVVGISDTSTQAASVEARVTRPRPTAHTLHRLTDRPVVVARAELLCRIVESVAAGSRV